MRYSLCLLAALAVLGLSSSAFAELVDNPSYQYWAKYKPGTSVTLQQSADLTGMPGMPATEETIITQKLLEVKPEAVTIQRTVAQMRIGVMGSTTRTINAKVEKGQEYAQGEASTKVEIKDMKEGQDTVDVMGIKMNAVTREYTRITTPATTGPATNPTATMMANGATSKIKTWFTPEVPGGIVKSEQTSAVGTMGTAKATIVVVDYTIVKEPAVASPSSVVIAELVDNPDYQDWAKYKPGSGVTLKQTTDFDQLGGQPTTTEAIRTETLLEVKPDAITIETTWTYTDEGRTRVNKTKRTINATVKKGQEYTPQGEAYGRVEIMDMKEGQDTVDVKGVKVNVVTREYKIIQTDTRPASNPAKPPESETNKIKTWSTPEVPGGKVRAERNYSSSLMDRMKTTDTLVDFTIVK
jgi:hypothetical protein